MDIEQIKVVAIIETELAGNCAKLKGIGILDKQNIFKRFDEWERKLNLPPYGYIFEPGFFKNHNYKIGDILSFWVEENPKSEGEQDKYRLRYKSAEVKSFGVNARRIKGFKKNDLSTDLSSIVLVDDESDGVFFGVTEKYIIGKLRVKNGKIEQALHHRVQIWDIEASNIILSKNCCRLLKEPDGESWTLDCMNDKQLFEWFRDLLKQIYPDYVKLLDSKASWRTELPKLFSKLDSERFKADEIRFYKISKKFELLNLQKIEAMNLVENSDNFNLVFTAIIEKHKEEFKQGYKNELEQYKIEIKQQKSSFALDLSKLQKQIGEKEKTVNNLSESIQIIRDEITSLNNNKERIIGDFSIVKEVLQGHNQTYNANVVEELESFIMEEAMHSDCFEMTSIDEFEVSLKYQLNVYNLNSKFSRKILNCFSVYNAMLIKDIRIGIALAKATNNSKYIIQQIGPDWLHFIDFWKNGLGAIWESAHENPEVYHFLLLEDINMSAPECYCRPLADILTGVRNIIPYGKTRYPQNLTILATYASIEDPEIGLPLNRDIFEEWGSVGFKGNIRDNSEKIVKPESSYLQININNIAIMDDFTKMEIENDVKIEFETILE